VARDLLGRALVYDSPDGRRAARIVEVEAYLGEQDPASHASRGPTPRAAVMFGNPGVAYVYFIYGNHHCMNVVAHAAGVAGAVLLRGAEPLEGLGDDVAGLRGPGRLARAFALTTAHTGLDLVRSPLHLRAGEPARGRDVIRSRRVGIAQSVTSERPWRFSIRGSAGVSR
jgi:DNA-3-methyladenine glycosylase